MKSIVKHLMLPQDERVPRVNVYLLRLVYALMLFVLGKDVWTHILTHQGEWEAYEAMAWSVWAAFASLSLIGMFQPVRMIPMLCLEVFYKLLWLALVAYPLWRSGGLAFSPLRGMTTAFLWVLLPIIAIPWPYVVRTYIFGKQAEPARAAEASVGAGVRTVGKF